MGRPGNEANQDYILVHRYADIHDSHDQAPPSFLLLPVQLGFHNYVEAENKTRTELQLVYLQCYCEREEKSVLLKVSSVEVGVGSVRHPQGSLLTLDVAVSV